MDVRALWEQAAARAIHYHETVNDRAVFPPPVAVERLYELGGPLPEQASDPADVLALLDDIGSPATVASTGGRYFGFVTGGALPATVATNWLAASWDQNVAFGVMSPVSATLEEISLAWIRDVLGLPEGTGGALVSGATMANFSALAAGRHAVLQRVGWDVEADGLFGAPPITVVVGGEAHASLLKALALVGLGRSRVITAPVDAQGRMRADDLPAIAAPAIVCLQAGNVNSGAFDPASEIIPWAHEAGAWVHVDGAFGLWAAAAPSRRHLMAGFSDADSWATDTHKYLNTPYDCGLALVRKPESLRAAMSQSAAYLPTGGQRDPSDFAPEFSRRARGVEVWAALRSLGRTGLAELVERCCQHATRFADGLRAAGYDVLNDVALNQVLVSFGDDETTRRVIAGVQADGACWCGGTVWHGRTAMRISVSSWATTEADVGRSLHAMLRVAADVRAG